MNLLRACALALFAFVTSCTTPGAADARPPLVAVSNLLHPPFSSPGPDGVPVGIEVDLVADAARRLGRPVEWVERPFSELLEAVALGEADVAASTIGITDERAQRVGFSSPYFATKIVALVRSGDGEPSSLEDLRGRRIGTERGTTAVSAAAERIPHALRVEERSPGRTWAQMLTAGEIDALILDLSHAEKFMLDAGVHFEIVDEPLRTERFAFAVHRDASDLRAALDAAIAAGPTR